MSNVGSEVTDDAELTQQLLRDAAGLRSQLARAIGDADLASDILHDAVVTALQKLHGGEITSRGQLDGYVYSVALNHYRNHRRKDKSAITDSEQIRELADTSERSRPEESLDSVRWARTVKELLREVTPIRDRELLVRYYLNEESKDDLCANFGLTELHFNRVIFRARTRFRELLERRGVARSDFLSILALLLMAH